MRKGKIAAQAGHAAVGAFAALINAGDPAGWAAAWRRRGEAKIALAVGSESEIRTLEAAGQRHGVNVYVVVDAGRTQIAAGSVTVLAVGPAPVEMVDKVTGHLKLL
ncbi:hypothetical protein MMPV_005375 [Pyropia vietnamensis]